MWKEIVICIMIIVIILIGNVVTQNYTKESIEDISGKLKNLEENIEKDAKNKEVLESKVKEINDNWEERHNKLAFYIEHDELEKFETNLKSLNSYLKNEVYEEVTNEIDKSIFILEHIEDKYAFNLQNIF